MRLLPRDGTFFELFLEHTRIVCDASELLETGLRSGYEGIGDISVRIKALEHKGDQIVQQIATRVRESILTPFDPDDTRQLATVLDDVLDFIENAAFLVVAYKLEPIPSELIQLSQIVNKSCNCLREGMENLTVRKSITEVCREIDRLEKKADLLQRQLLRELFSTETDPVRLLKQKELFEGLEAVTDRCDDVANLLQKIGIKNA